MPDGAQLPYCAWLPSGAPAAVILALHGCNDSRRAWELPAPSFAAEGIAFYAPDQRGFGGAPLRGEWPGSDVLVADAADLARQVQALHPGTPLVLIGESMGGAALMLLATSSLAPPAARYVFLAPAVWSRALMALWLRTSLWILTTSMPRGQFSGEPIRFISTNNVAALVRLHCDPLTIRRVSGAVLRGLLDLMDAAWGAAPRLAAPSLFLYGGRDHLVPPQATAATWQALPSGEADGPRMAFYEGGHHLLLRDLEREVRIADCLAWIGDPKAALPSGAEQAAEQWLRGMTSVRI